MLIRHRNRLYTFIFLLVCTCIFVGCTLSSSQTTQEVVYGTQVGNHAPDFTLTSIEGKEVSLSQYEGKTVILNFFASWCPPCKIEMPAFEAISVAHEDTVVVGVNLQEDPDAVITFGNELGITFPLLLDPEESVKRLYQIRTQPVTFFIDEEGIITDKKLGPLTDEELEGITGKLFQVTENEQDVMYLDDGTPYLLHPDQLRSGGPPKDGIPSIDDPQFISVEDADEIIFDDEWVVGITRNGITRAYPFHILVWHELVNDVVGDEALLVSYCPLCGTAIVYDRTIGNDAVEFGVSGMLYNSDMIMYDRLSDTYWEQLTGRAVIGELTGTTLTRIPSDTMLWGEWKQLYPDSEVLSRDTGHIRRYGSDPYGDYYTSSRLIFPVEESSDLLHEKEVIYGLEINGEARAYPKEELKKQGTLQDTLGGVKLGISHTDASVQFTNMATGESVAPVRAFWFAWYAFYPHTDVFE